MHKILIVEDEKNARTAITTFFKECGYAVESAANAVEAVAVAGRFAPTILISDWMLGEQGDGINVARRLRQFNPQLAVIFVSGYSLDRLRQQCRDLPVTAFFEKPVSLIELSSAVSHIAETG